MSVTLIKQEVISMKTTCFDPRQSQKMTIPKDEYNKKINYWELIYPRCKECYFNNDKEKVPGMNCNYPDRITIKDSKCTNFKEGL